VNFAAITSFILVVDFIININTPETKLDLQNSGVEKWNEYAPKAVGVLD